MMNSNKNKIQGQYRRIMKKKRDKRKSKTLSNNHAIGYINTYYFYRVGVHTLRNVRF
jgi:hypothetical protein